MVYARGMLVRMRSLVSLATLLVLGCNPEVIEADAAGDEQGESSSSSESSSSGESSDSSGSTSDTTTSDPTTTESTSDTSDTTTDTTTETGGQPLHSCGWLPDEGYYFCGSTGEPDPSMTFPMDCAVFEFPMINDTPCGSELTFVGCCDANGDAWYCDEGFVVYEVCSAL